MPSQYHSEEPLHEIEPRRVRWREVQMEARLPEQPAMHDPRAVRGQVVQYDVHLERRFDACLDLAESVAASVQVHCRAQERPTCPTHPPAVGRCVTSKTRMRSG